MAEEEPTIDPASEFGTDLEYEFVGAADCARGFPAEAECGCEEFGGGILGERRRWRQGCV